MYIEFSLKNKHVVQHQKVNANYKTRHLNDFSDFLGMGR